MQNSVAVMSAVEANVDVAIAGDLERRNTFKIAETRRNFSRDRLRRFAQLARELKSYGQRDLTEFRLFGLLDRDGYIRVEVSFDERRNGVLYGLLE